MHRWARFESESHLVNGSPNTFYDYLRQRICMRYYQHHIGDFIKDTYYLTNEEVAIYLKLIWLYYDTEKPLPNDLPLLTTKVNAKTKEDIVLNLLKLYFVLKDDCWVQFRCEQTITEYQKQLEAASKAGKASAAKRKSNATSTAVQQPLNDSTTSVQLTNNHKPITNNHNIKTKATAPKVATPDGVSDSVWNDFLILRKAKKMAVTSTALKGLVREATKANKPLEEVLAICCERGWGGFKAEWVAEQTQKAKDLPLGTDQQIEEAYRTECGGDPRLARFGSYFEMKKFILDKREKRARA